MNSQTSLSENTITFGKYKNSTLETILKDRSYCSWLLQQDWFRNNYAYLYNRVKEYDPRVYFLKPYEGESESFLDHYMYFNMVPIEELKIVITNEEEICYAYYLKMIQEFKIKILERLDTDNPYNIKAPSRWLKRFETETELKRETFKIFLASYGLPNIPYIVEAIKKEGGIEYKGAQSFNIAKKRSEDQEKYWENILKEKYGEDLGTQFKYEKCIFDFLNISTSTIFECKLGMKDFSEEQHKKYLITLDKYRIIYLIGYDCVVYIDMKEIYTIDKEKYDLYLIKIPFMKTPSQFDNIIKDFNVIEIKELSILFGTKQLREIHP